MPEQRATIVFEPPFRDANAAGLSGVFPPVADLGLFRHPANRLVPHGKAPRLGGNKRMGVFATRSPFRPNPLGLSSVRLLGMEPRPGQGIVLLVAAPI